MTDDARRRALAKLHIAKKDLGLDEDTYRAVLENYGGASSSARFDGPAFNRVFRHLEELGWKPKRRRPNRGPNQKHRLLGKIGAQLSALGLGSSYADGIANKMFGIERYEWLTPEQLHKVVAALTYHQKRRAADGG